MKIALTTSAFPPDNESAPFPASFELARALMREGHDVLVLTITEGETRVDIHEGIRVFRQKFDIREFPGLLFPFFSATAGCLPRALMLHSGSKQILEEFQPDVIESQDFNGLGLFFALERKYPLVVRVYGPLAHLLREGVELGTMLSVDVELIHSMEIATVGAADGRISLCSDIARQMANWSGVPVERFTVLPTLIGPEKIEQYPHVPAAPGSPFPRLLYWGRIQKQKGVDLLVEALPAVAARYPNFRLELSGSETYSGSFGNEMRNRLDEMKLSSNVEFLGFRSSDELRERVGSTDICVFPSRYETACYAAIEAALYGGCVLATRVGGLPEHILDGTSGHIVEPESANALAEGILKLAADDELRRHLRTSAAADVTQRCAPEKNAQGTLEVYQEAIKSFKDKNTYPNPTVNKVAEAFLTGFRTTHYNYSGGQQAWEERYTHEFVCEKYSEGARAGYEQGLAEGLKIAEAAQHDSAARRSLVGRIAGKVRRLTKGT